MPDFGSSFSGLANDRKLTHDELAIEVLKDIADEERVLTSEFVKLLHELAPDEEKFYN